MKPGRLLLLFFLFILIGSNARASHPEVDMYLASSTMALLSTETPDQPGIISGPDHPCPGSVQTYSINPVPLAHHYSWDVPSGVTKLVDNNSTSIQVSIPNNCSGNISVTAIGNDFTESPVRDLPISSASFEVEVEPTSYIRSYILNGDTYYELSRDKNPRDFVLDVQTNMNGGYWTISSLAAWLHCPSIQYSSDTEALGVDYDLNNSGTEYISNLMFQSVSLIKEIFVVLKPHYIDYGTVSGDFNAGDGSSSNPCHLDKEGGTLSVDFSTNSSWELTLPAWLTQTSGTSSGSGGSFTLEFSFDRTFNPVTQPEGIIEISSEGTPINLHLIQEMNVFQPTSDAGTFITRSVNTETNDSVTVQGAASSFVIDMELVNVPGTIIVNDPWIENHTSFDDSESPIQFQLESNPSAKTTRTGTLQLTAESSTKTFTLIQQKGAPQMSISEPDNYIEKNTVGSTTETQFVLDKAGDSFNVTLTSNTDWEVSSIPDWMTTADPTTGSEETATLNFQFESFAGVLPRHGQLIFTSSYITRTLYFEQENYSLELTPDPGSYILENTIPVGYEVSATEYILPTEEGELVVDILTNVFVNISY